MIDDPAEILATEPATSRATAAELTALAWVRKARPDLDPDEQRALAARLSEKLPTLREPTKSRADDPLTVRERIPRFLAKLQAIPLTEKRRISGFVGQEKRELFELYKIRYVRSSLTDYRNAVRAAFGADHPAVTYLHLNETDVADVNESDRAQVRYRQTALRPIDPDRLIDIAVQLIASTSMYEIGMGIALLCGRRPFEIFNTGAIELDPDRPADHLRFFGQAKTKGSAPLPSAPSQHSSTPTASSTPGPPCAPKTTPRTRTTASSTNPTPKPSTNAPPDACKNAPKTIPSTTKTTSGSHPKTCAPSTPRSPTPTSRRAPSPNWLSSTRSSDTPKPTKPPLCPTCASISLDT
jgi:hypothetical protein